MKYKVVEKFISINGEGNLAGELAVFIRFAGCNLKCSYCDTMWANEGCVEYELMSKEDIHNYIKSSGITNVTITGGEPLIQDEMMEMLKYLSLDGSINIEIETNGSVKIESFLSILPKPPVFTIDYKLASSNMESEMQIDNYSYLKKEDSVKFVVGSIADLKRAKEIMDSYRLIKKCNVQLSPVFGEIDMKTIVDFMKSNKMNGVKLQPQLHKIIWDYRIRGV